LPDDVTELFEVHIPLKHDCEVDCEVVNAWDTSIKENAPKAATTNTKSSGIIILSLIISLLSILL
jgi:hypothetical protein